MTARRARHIATTANRQGVGARRDAYRVILFNQATTQALSNEFTSSPDKLLGTVLQYWADGGTNFWATLRTGQAVMEQNWSTERFVASFCESFV
jgi:hypothetical protein